MAIYDGNITYKGKPLFRGGIMNSGSITPTDPIDSEKGQDVYDKVAQSAGCDIASNTLECLRQLDYKSLLVAVFTLFLASLQCSSVRGSSQDISGHVRGHEYS